MQFHASTTIDAPAQAVWDVLVDLASWHEWDPHVQSVSGTATLGGKVTVRTDLSSVAVPVEVAELDAPHRMVWTGGMPFGLFVGTRTFSLDEVDGTTTFTLHEDFTGALLPLMRRVLPDLQPAFDGQVAGLRARVEG
jgi:hypothetical protein